MSNVGQIEAWNAHYEGMNMMLIPDIRIVRWLNQIPAGARRQHHLLELGCGNGRHAILAAKMGYRVVAVDYSPNAISALRIWASIEGLSDLIEAYEVDITKECALTDLHTTLDVGLSDMMLCWGVMEYFDDDTVMRILEEASYMCWQNARCLLMTRGPTDFCYQHAERSDGFMDLHKRSGGDWTFLLSKQRNWGGDVTVDSRLESFCNMVIGGVEGGKKEQMLFLEAMNLERSHSMDPEE